MQKLSVLAISLDETETEIAAWNQKVNNLKEWKHLRADKGISSKVANDYFILATPVMILIDARTKKIISLPSTFTQLKTELP
jgi:thioredoxin-related protein